MSVYTNPHNVLSDKSVAEAENVVNANVSIQADTTITGAAKGKTIQLSTWINWLVVPWHKLRVVWFRMLLQHVDVRPRHVGIILDGNRRFASRQGMKKPWMGHILGAHKVEQVLEWLRLAGVRVVSIWIFSLENFRRPPEEVAALMQLFESELKRLAKNPKIQQYSIRVRAFGRRESLPPSLREAISQAEAATQHHHRFFLNVGIAYSGQEEVIHAIQCWLKAQAKQSPSPSLIQIAQNLSPQVIHQYLYNAEMPDPDLIIRTSGEQRISGFLLWQSAYAEYYFCPVPWPCIREHHILKAIFVFAQRKRRFGL